MTLSVSFAGASDGDDGPFDLMSIGAFTAFTDWINTLPEDDFPTLYELARDGSAGPTDALSTELTEALSRRPPDQAVRHSAMALAEQIGMGAPDELCAITDGTEDDPEDAAT